MRLFDVDWWFGFVIGIGVGILLLIVIIEIWGDKPTCSQRCGAVEAEVVAHSGPDCYCRTQRNTLIWFPKGNTQLPPVVIEVGP